MDTDQFEEEYECWSVSGIKEELLKSNIEYSGKILMPSSALDRLSRLEVSYPMMFKLVNEEMDNLSTHCGVLEFSSPEGIIHVPQWIMKLLKLSDGDIIKVTNITLPIGSKITIQPQSVDFLDIDDPKFALEQSLGTFSALTLDDIIAIKYNNKVYELRVIDAEPSNEGISIIETDLQVEFVPPLGYKEPERSSYSSYGGMGGGGKSLAGSLGSSLLTGSPSSSSGFVSFSGASNKLNTSKPNESGTDESNGKITSSTDNNDSSNVLSSSVPGSISIPSGTLYFGSRNQNINTPSGGALATSKQKTEGKKWNSFSGTSNKLR